MSTKNKKIRRGRPATILPTIKQNSILFISKTPLEIVDILHPKLQSKMKGGESQDPLVVKAQKASLYQNVVRYHRDALAAGKKLNFSGRLVNGEKKTKWIHSAK